jgi:hypothetical protein
MTEMPCRTALIIGAGSGISASFARSPVKAVEISAFGGFLVVQQAAPP